MSIAAEIKTQLMITYNFITMIHYLNFLISFQSLSVCMCIETRFQGVEE